MGPSANGPALFIASNLRLAKEDLDGARALLAIKNRNAIYLCEQAAEKIIKAILTSENIQGGIKHELDDKINPIPDLNPMKAELRKIEHLSAYATSYRYPTPAGKIPPAPLSTVVDEEILKLQKLLIDVASHFRVDLTQPNTAAKSIAPIR